VIVFVPKEGDEMSDRSSRPTILLVDDGPENIDVLQGLLQGDYKLRAALNGERAIKIATSDSPPDLILLDVMMPGMDGFEVCRRLKADKECAHIPVVLVTALGSKEDLARGLDSGADDFLHKPVDPIELGARVRSMLRIKKQYDDLQASIGLREDLAHMIVHDMRNPLSTITLSCGLLQKMITEPRAAAHVGHIRTQAQRLVRFMDDILMTAKLEYGMLAVNRALTRVEEVVQHTREDFDLLGLSREVNLVVELPKDSRPVFLDVRLFQRVLDNLLSNAFKVSPVGGTVTLRVSYPDEGEPQLRVQVLDEGPGIPKEHHERIFRKFEVGPLSRQGVAQMGLGLAFCQLVVEAHGGRIYVQPNAPQGSVFTVEI
jgi:two-component system, sensor histidine kinase and response regulator